MEKKLEQFKQLIMEITDLGRAEALLGWDQQVYMPRGGAEDRGGAHRAGRRPAPAAPHGRVRRSSEPQESQ